MEEEHLSKTLDVPNSEADNGSDPSLKTLMKFSINTNTNLVGKSDGNPSSEKNPGEKLKIGDDGFKKPILIGPRKPKKVNVLVKPKETQLSPMLPPKSNESVVRLSSKKLVPEKPLVKPMPVIESESLVIEAAVKKITPSEVKSQPVTKPATPPPPCSYQEPHWKGIPEENYSLEEVKGGLIEREIELSGRSMSLVGRLEECDLTLAHPSVSRYHAVIQYRASRQGIYDKGFYLYDLASTHGTFLNRNRIKPNTFMRIQVGHMLKFGGSSRFFILKGPEGDQEPESEFSVTELKEMRRAELEERQRKAEEEEQERKEREEKLKRDLENRGVDWGMGEDADEESDLSENPYAITTNEELYGDDPKKELKKWFEREGDELHFEVEQAERGKIVCRVTLPLDNEKGGDVVIESTGRSKKEATTSCALEACRYIDRQGIFRQSNQEARKRQVRNWEENDYYDSDEDNYYDRTGQIDQKRQKRMEKAGVIKNSVQTYDSLMESHNHLVEELEKAEKKLSEVEKAMRKGARRQDGLDELDAYMLSLQQDMPTKKQLKAAQDEVEKLRKEEASLVALINVARPASLPELRQASYTQAAEHSAERPTELPPPRDVQPPSVQPTPPISQSTPSAQPPAKILGPVLPSSEEMREFEKKKRVRTRNRQRIPKAGTYDEDDFNNLTWKPPEGQTGDGRTSLNDKLGY